jgi:hypothetical protein
VKAIYVDTTIAARSARQAGDDMLLQKRATAK